MQKELSFPRPIQRISKIAVAAMERHPRISTHANMVKESSIPGDFKTWRVDLTVGLSSQPTTDLNTLFDGDAVLAAALRKKIHKRLNKKQIDPRTLAFQIVKEVASQPWGWQFFGVRVMDKHKLGNNLSKLINLEDLIDDDLPNLGSVMMFAGEEAARQSWNLVRAAKNSLSNEKW